MSSKANVAWSRCCCQVFANKVFLSKTGSISVWKPLNQGFQPDKNVARMHYLCKMTLHTARRPVLELIGNLRSGRVGYRQLQKSRIGLFGFQTLSQLKFDAEHFVEPKLGIFQKDRMLPMKTAMALDA